ncbi:MAG: hypothetical protein GXZ11_06615 [Tissierellia bacterium]|nr:hypothetical protein [Tissierellia bacterium]
MDKTWYLENLKRKMGPYYDIQEDVAHNGYLCDIYARFFIRNERYIATKKAVIYGVEKNQHIFVKYVPKIGVEELNHLTEHLDYVVNNWVKPSEDHMSTFVRGILVTDGIIETAAAEQAKKYKCEKSYFFGIQGWTYGGINLVDLNDSSNCVHNRRGKEDLHFFVIEDK